MMYARQRVQALIAFLVLLALIGGVWLAYKYRRFLGFADANAPSIVFTSSPQILTEGAASSPVQIQVQNPDKSPHLVDQVTEIKLSTDAKGTFSVDRNGPFDKTSVTIVTGESATAFWYQPDEGSANKLIHKIIASAPLGAGWNEGIQNFQVRQKTNLLENGSFELWVVKPEVRWSGWRYLPDCTGDGYQVNNCSIEAGPGTPRSGNFYRRFDPQGYRDERDNVIAYFPGSYGRLYTVSAWIKPITTPTTLGLSFRFEGEGVPTKIASTSITVAQNDWQQIFYTLPEQDIPTDARYTRFRIDVTKPSNLVYVDDFAVVEGKEPLKTADSLYLVSQTTTSRTKQNTTTLAFDRTPESASVSGRAHLFDKDGKEIPWAESNLTSRNIVGQEEALLVGGDISWTDYEFEAEVSDVYGKADLALVVRHYPYNPAEGPGSNGNYGHGYWYQEESSKQRSSLFRLNNHKWGEPRGDDPNPTNSWQELAGSEQVVSAGDWHKMKVRVEGQTITAYLDGVQKFQVTDPVDKLPEEDKKSDRYRKGSVALYSRGSAKAKNLIVRDLQNNILFSSSPYAPDIESPIVSASFAERQRPGSENWWDENYLWRKKITIDNPTTPVGANMVLQLQVSEPNEAADLFFKLASRAPDYPNAPTGQDLRLVYFHPRDKRFVELDRDLLVLDQNKITLVFNTQMDIHAKNNDYFLYFGNKDAPVALTNKNNIYSSVGFWPDGSPVIWRFIYGQRDWKIIEPGTYLSQQPQELTLIAPELVYDNQYTVRIDSGVKADDQHILTAPVYFNFRTKKQPAGALPSSIKVSDGGLEVSGQKILPILLYNFPLENEAVVQDVKSKGINTISAPNPYAGAAAQKGFWTLASGADGHGGVKMEFITEPRQASVLNDWDEPNIIAWHTDSEPDLKLSRGFTHEDFGAMVQAMKAVDPLSRPTYTDGGSSYAAHTDVIGNEAYEYSHNIRDLIFSIFVSAESNNYAILNSPNPGSRINTVDLNISPYSGTKNSNYPQKGEMRPKIYTAIIHGAKWLSEFSYDPSEGVGPVPQVAPEAWQELGEANNEILAIKDAIVAPATPQIQMVYPAAQTTFLGKSPWFELSKRGIDHKLFRQGDKGYLVTQNVSDKTEKAYFSVAGAQNIKDKNNHRDIDAHEGKFFDTFGPYESQIYSFDLVKSSDVFQITSTNPPTGKNDVSPDRAIVVQFNHQLDDGSLKKDDIQFRDGGGPVEFSWQYDPKERRLKIIPGALELDSSYVLDFSREIKDRQGIGLEPHKLEFKTAKENELPANILGENFSFEKGILAPWVIENPVNLTGEVINSTSQDKAHSGDKFLKLSYGGDASGGLLARDEQAQAGQRYTATIWARSPTAGSEVYLGEHFYDAGRNLLGDYQNEVFKLTDKWQRLAISRVAPVGTAAVYVRFQKTSQAPALTALDDTAFRETDARPPQVTKTIPATGAKDTAINASVEVTFDKKMSPVTLVGAEWNAYIQKKDTGKIQWVKLSYNEPGRSLELDPDENFELGATYQVTLVGGEGSIEDETGNKLAQNYTFDFTTTAPPDMTAPEISDIKSSEITSSSAKITWKTNEAANSQVEYGKTRDLGQTLQLNDWVIEHSVKLEGLEQEITYYYKIKSKDTSGNESSSALYEFRTQKAQKSLPQAVGRVVGGVAESVTQPIKKAVQKASHALSQTWAKITGSQGVILPSQVEPAKPAPAAGVAQVQAKGRQNAPQVLLIILGAIVVSLIGYLYWLRKRQPPM